MQRMPDMKMATQPADPGGPACLQEGCQKQSPVAPEECKHGLQHWDRRGLRLGTRARRDISPDDEHVAGSVPCISL